MGPADMGHIPIFTATYFSVTFYPGNNSLMVGFDGVSYIEGKVVAFKEFNGGG
jgi:hypothetical protein